MEEPIRIDHGEESLFGMLHLPERQPVRAALLVVNSRVEYRVGPHRFYVQAARRWAEQGFAVLRLDYPGNGDSSGSQNYPHMDSFPVPPAVEAARVLQVRSGASDVVLVGLCMGARNALYAAAESEDVGHLIAFGMPFSDTTPHVTGEQGSAPRTVGTSVARSTMGKYLERVRDPKAWRRLLSGQSDYGVIRRVLPAALGLGRGQIFKEPIFRALDTLLTRGGRIQFVFGTNDVFLPDFREQFERVRGRLPKKGSGCETDLVPNANHTFSRVTWQREAIEHSANWLEQRFPAEKRSSA